MPAPSGATAKYGFPYLLESDVPDVATASQDLAQAVENELILVTQQPGTILASKAVTSANYNASSASFVCIDSTNVKLTFTAPPSGNVLLTESTLWNVATVGENIRLVWSNGTTNNTGLLGTWVVILPGFNLVEHRITGLTPGTSYTVALQWAYTAFAGTMNAGNAQVDLILKATAL